MLSDFIYKKVPSVKVRFWIMAIAAFIGVISFFQVNSYMADKNDINWLFKTIGWIFCGIAVTVLISLLKDRPKKDERD